jgi:catechol 2,3-dioxygenase-like lactoylglutathione lyase family enzyme
LRIHHVALRVTDCQRAAAFYGSVLGLQELRRSEEMGRLRAVWLALDQGVLMLEHSLRGAGPEAGSGHVLAFAVDDLATWEQRLSEAGIAITDRTAYTVFVNDPDGHRVALSIFPL